MSEHTVVYVWVEWLYDAVRVWLSTILLIINTSLPLVPGEDHPSLQYHETPLKIFRIGQGKSSGLSMISQNLFSIFCLLSSYIQNHNSVFWYNIGWIPLFIPHSFFKNLNLSFLMKNIFAIPTCCYMNTCLFRISNFYSITNKHNYYNRNVQIYTWLNNDENGVLDFIISENS